MLRAAAAQPDPTFWRGGETLRVPVSLHAANRARLLEALATELVDRGIAPGVVVLQGGREQRKYDTDGEHVFRQESFFQWVRQEGDSTRAGEASACKVCADAHACPVHRRLALPSQAASGC